MNMRMTLLITCLVAAGCSKNNNPAGNSGTGGSGGTGTGSCRTYPTAATVTTTNSLGGAPINATLTGTFNSAAKTATITVSVAGGGLCSTSVQSYASVADFVDEVRVVPPVFIQQQTATTNSGGCGSGTQTTTYVYDAQKRLVSATSNGVATTYTAWDSSGRATLGSFPGTTITNAYNDAARTMTQTQAVAASGTVTSTTVSSYDANGNQLTVVVTSGPVVSTTTYTTTATAQVCK